MASWIYQFFTSIACIYFSKTNFFMSYIKTFYSKSLQWFVARVRMDFCLHFVTCNVAYTVCGSVFACVRSVSCVQCACSSLNMTATIIPRQTDRYLCRDSWQLDIVTSYMDVDSYTIQISNALVLCAFMRSDFFMLPNSNVSGSQLLTSWWMKFVYSISIKRIIKNNIL